MTLPVIACLTCVHFHGDDTCDAFPEKIPGRILHEGTEHHLEPVIGDHDIQYEPRSKA